MKPNTDLRWRAREHFENADILLKRGNINELRYAALEIRMCIEAIFYELILTYYDSLPITIKKKWTPKDVINEVLQSIPDADKSVTVHIGIEEQPGMESRSMTSIGTDHRLDAKWANKAYNSIGSFLHCPSIAQLEDGKDHNREKLLAKLKEIRSELWKVIKSPIFNVRMDFDTISFTCKCGFTIRRCSDVLDKPIACMNCGEVYEHKTENNEHRFFVMEHSFKCDYCAKESTLKAQSVAEGRRFRCCICDGEYLIVKALVAEPTQKEKLGS